MSKEQELLDEAYENYFNNFKDEWIKQYQSWLGEFNHSGRPISKEEFINKCKTDTEFSEKWGLKIEERELSLLERVKIYGVDKIQTNDAGYYEHSYAQFKVDEAKIPTKLITISLI